MPESMQRVVAKYQRDNDLVLQFLEERFDQNPGGRIKQKDCYELYKMWCRKNGYMVMSNKKFKAELMKHPGWVFGEPMIHGYLFYLGISLKE
jgi:putative DNA primase/helicase